MKAQGSSKQIKQAGKARTQQPLVFAGRGWKEKVRGKPMKESRGDRIIARQRQCGACQFEGELEEKGRKYGYCMLKKKRFIDLSIWVECRDYKARSKERSRAYERETKKRV